MSVVPFTHLLATVKNYSWVITDRFFCWKKLKISYFRHLTTNLCIKLTNKQKDIFFRPMEPGSAKILTHVQALGLIPAACEQDCILWLIKGASSIYTHCTAAYHTQSVQSACVNTLVLGHLSPGGWCQKKSNTFCLYVQSVHVQYM